MNGDQAVETIQIRLEHVAQIFNMLDPFPFRQRDLSSDAADYIVEWARELPKAAALSIVVFLPDAEARTPQAVGLPEAMRHFFAHRAEVAEQELKELFRTGRIVLAIGLAVLAACLILAQGITGRIGERTLTDFLHEGLIIVGWVALWRPLEIFLYDWWPLRRQRNLYRRIAAAQVEVKASPVPSPA